MSYIRQNYWKSLLFSFFLFQTGLFAQSLSSDFYDIGTPTLTDYYVDPSSGNDDNNGTSRSSPKRTVTDIWNSIPQNTTLTSGVRINLLPGTYTSDHLPNYWEDRTGTSSAPIIMQALDGYGTVFLTRDINMANVSYFYLLAVDIKNRTDGGYGDSFHCENCNYILLRGNSFNGAPNGRNGGGDVAHETIKFNQSQYIYIENNNIQGSDDNAIDWVSVQYGHIRSNRIHDTQGWCAYVKGGSSYILIESNIAYNCGEGGITAGQGTGFEFMVEPYLRFEANYIKIVNNIIHDIEGAALGINGGYGILVAHNTAYRVGSRSHLLEVVFGERSCDGDTAACAARRAAGGWGPTGTGSENSQPIGNQDIVIANNVFYNPSGFTSGSQHFAIYGPRTPSASGIPSPQRTDTNLKIQGNLIWNGTNSMPLGIEDSDQGCQPSNTTCNQSQMLSENTINSLQPDFIDAANDDFRPAANGNIAATASVTIPNLPSIDSGLTPITEGDLNNQMVREFSGALVSTRPPGAIVSSTSTIEFPGSTNGGGTTPGAGSSSAPTLSISKLTASKSGKKANVKVSAIASDADGISSVVASIMSSGREIASLSLALSGNKYSGSKKIKITKKLKKISVMLTATDSAGSTTSKTKSVKIK